MRQLAPLILFNVIYLIAAGSYFLRDLNFEFVIYVVGIVAIFSIVLATLKHTKFPIWMLWLLSFWGLMHVLGGWVQTPDGVLFAYRIYPLLDLGGEFYILKYDQFVHTYLYGLVAVMAYHVVRNVLLVKDHATLVFILAVMASVGISALNEIIEFLIAVNLDRHGVGGYVNSMLDLCFNLGGAVIALTFYKLSSR